MKIVQTFTTEQIVTNKYTNVSLKILKDKNTEMLQALHLLLHFAIDAKINSVRAALASKFLYSQA